MDEFLRPMKYPSEQTDPKNQKLLLIRRRGYAVYPYRIRQHITLPLKCIKYKRRIPEYPNHQKVPRATKRSSRPSSNLKRPIQNTDPILEK